MRCFSLFYFFCCLFTGFILTASSWAGPVKLNPELVSGGQIEDFFMISPDSHWVVYKADQEREGIVELFSVPVDGGTAVKLNPELVACGSVYGFGISSDSTHVVYRAMQETTEHYELFSVPIGGGTTVKLNSALPPGGIVWEHGISPDGNRVVYRAEQETDNVFELYSVPITGGTPVKLNAELVTGGNVSAAFSFSSDSSRVVYKADQETDNVFELYSVPITGGTPVKLNADLVAGGDVNLFRISKDGSRVVYIADQEADNVSELFSVPITGGTPVKLNGVLVAGGNVNPNFILSDDSNWVVYRADQETDSVFELYSVPITGGIPVKLNADLVAGGDVFSEYYAISPDSSRVVYRADQETDGVDELYSVPITGGTPVKLNADLVAGGNVHMLFFFSPDSTRVVYRADQETDNVFELYSVPITGGTPVKLNAELTASGNVAYFFEISPDGRRVVYTAKPTAVGSYELFSVPITGGTSVKLNADLAPGGDVASRFRISTDCSKVVYRADQETVGVFELFSQNLAPRLYYPHIGGSLWTTEIAVINTHASSMLTGILMAYNDTGEAVSAGETISLQPRGRREINVEEYFPGATYAIFTGDLFDHMRGYTKFANSEKYRVAVPAVDHINRGNIHIPHVASDSNWWTGISLVNTTPLSRTITIVCSNGTSFTRNLEPFEHQAFTFAAALGGPQPDIASAEIQNAGGIIGLELFGHKKEPQLSGVLLRDQTEEMLYFPHAASNDLWWTGICAYNPNDAEVSLEITSYSDAGDILSTDNKTILPGGKYIGPFRNLDLDENSAWFEITADAPITGFELFGRKNGSMLAGFTAVGIKHTTGIFPKIETDGWTGIAFVNTGSATAVVTLRAYNNSGIRIAEEPITVCPNCKKVGWPEELFIDDISGASYLTYSSTQAVVGFQLNGSSNGMMLDGLPGM